MKSTTGRASGQTKRFHPVIILEEIEAPTTLGERISASEAEVARLNRLSLNATGLVATSFLLTFGGAFAGAFIAHVLEISTLAGLAPTVVISGLALWGSFRLFDRRTKRHIEASKALRELKAEARALKRVEAD